MRDALLTERVLNTMRHEAIQIQKAVSSLEYEPAVLQAVSLLAHCQGKIAVSGMGKVGYVGHRFAMTLASTGSPAFFLHPGEAQHGDLGMLGDNDILVACSNSGRTREVCETVKQVVEAFPLIAILVITGKERAELCTHATLVLPYGDVLEACPLGLTPTASMAVVGALLDGLALAVMETKNFTRRDYARRHHAGYLGEKARYTNM